MIRPQLLWSTGPKPTSDVARMQHIPRPATSIIPQNRASHLSSYLKSQSPVTSLAHSIRTTKPANPAHDDLLMFNFANKSAIPDFQCKQQVLNISSTNLHFRNKTVNLSQTPPQRHPQVIFEQVTPKLDSNKLTQQVDRLRREFHLALKQNEELRHRIKEYEKQKEQFVTHRNYHVVKLLEDYSNMKQVVERLIGDNLALKIDNQKLHSQTVKPQVKPTQTDTTRKLKEQIQELTQDNFKTQAEHHLRQYKQLLQSKQKEVQHLRSNQVSLQDKLQELLDGLRFYSERFGQEKAELLDDHENFKMSAIREICGLKAQVVELSGPSKPNYDFEKDANYIKLICY